MRKVGTGCIVRLEPDAVYIVTVAHVVEGDKHPNVTFFTRPNNPVAAEVVGLEAGESRGFALLLVRETEYQDPDLAVLPLAPSLRLASLDEVTVIGFPRLAGPWSVITARVASRRGRDILLDGAIDEGFSGGPMLKDGQIAGLILETFLHKPSIFLCQVGSPYPELRLYKQYLEPELPQHEVCLDGFWMGKTEVTQPQWRQVMGSNPSYFTGDSRPVEQVSWNAVQEFLKTLNTRTGTENYRLPTEAEWEYVARVGTTTPFSFGETISTDQANYNGDYIYGFGVKGVYREQTTEVGTFPPNAWGLHDMHGNVWEWCQDWYDSGYYATSPKDNPQGPDRGGSRVLRGGSWYNYPHRCRSAARSRSDPDIRSNVVGFRVVGGVVAWTP